MGSVVFVYKKSSSDNETILGIYSNEKIADRAIKNYCEKYPRYFKKCFRKEIRLVDVDYI